MVHSEGNLYIYGVQMDIETGRWSYAALCANRKALKVDCDFNSCVRHVLSID